MRKLILKMSMSVDGFVGGTKSDVDWIFATMDEGTMDWTMKSIWQADAHIMGSRRPTQPRRPCATPLARVARARTPVAVIRRRSRAGCMRV